MEVQHKIKKKSARGAIRVKYDCESQAFEKETEKTEEMKKREEKQGHKTGYSAV